MTYHLTPSFNCWVDLLLVFLFTNLYCLPLVVLTWSAHTLRAVFSGRDATYDDVRLLPLLLMNVWLML